MHNYKIYTSPKDTWDAIYEDCKAAEHSIYFEQYILMNDKLGEKFTELFCKKAKDGIKIFLLIDKIGSLEFYFSGLAKKLRNYGAKVTFYNSVNFWNLFQPFVWFPRDHSKTTLIDDKILYIGGVCFDEDMADWRDTHMRITGPVTKQASRTFDFILNKKDAANPLDFLDEQNGYDIQFHSNFLKAHRNHIYSNIIKGVTNSKKYIYLATPFFLPNRRFRKVLAKAARRKVEILLLLPMESDIRFADYVSESYFRRALKNNIRIFLYKRTVMHAKTIIIDDSWATVGSSNLDYLSFFKNRESNVFITNRKIIEDLKGHFLKDLSESVEVTLESWKRRPLHRKILGIALRPIKRLL